MSREGEDEEVVKVKLRRGDVLGARGLSSRVFVARQEIRDGEEKIQLLAKDQGYCSRRRPVRESAVFAKKKYRVDVDALGRWGEERVRNQGSQSGRRF